MRIVLIGAGISSSLISLLLRRQFGPQVKLVVYDKGRAIGNASHSHRSLISVQLTLFA